MYMDTDDSHNDPPPNVCIICQKKIKLGTVVCRCRLPLCRQHVWSENHECMYDYKGSERERLRKTNPTIIPQKIEGSSS
jgi:hypothetical protein